MDETRLSPPSNLLPQTTTFQLRSSEPFSEPDTFLSQDVFGHSANSTVDPIPQRHCPHLPYPNSTEADYTRRGSEQTPSNQLPLSMTNDILWRILFPQHHLSTMNSTDFSMQSQSSASVIPVSHHIAPFRSVTSQSSSTSPPSAAPQASPQQIVRHRVRGLIAERNCGVLWGSREHLPLLGG